MGGANEAKICNKKWVMSYLWFQYAHAPLIFDLVSKSQHVYFPMCQCWQNNWLCMEHLHTERHKYDQTNFYCTFCLHSLECLNHSNDICDPKWCLKCPRIFLPPLWQLPTTFFSLFFLFFPVVMTQAIIKMFGAVYIFCWYVLWFLSSTGM